MVLRTLCSAAGFVLLLACGSGEPAEKPAVPPPVAPKIEAPDPDRAEPPAQETDSEDTAERLFECIDGDAAAGGLHYATLCATCHGASGDGKGPAAAGLNPKPVLHVDGNVMNPIDNDHLFKVIREGGPAVGKSALMAAWGGALSDTEIWDVVAFVRSLADPPYSCP